LTSWPFSFAGKISRAASRNKKTVTAAAQRLRFPWRYQAGTVCSAIWKYGAAETRPDRGIDAYIHEQGLVERKVEIEELFHFLTLDITKIR
jgi:hypothetical protein